MTDRRLVLDANIIVRAVLGIRVRELIERYCTEVPLLAPATAFAEVEEHLPMIYAKRGLSADVAMQVYARVSGIVQELPVAFYSDHEFDARRRMERRDLEDWPVLACALALECPLWTEDRDFFGSGVPIWTTDRVEIYLAGATLTSG